MATSVPSRRAKRQPVRTSTQNQRDYYGRSNGPNKAPPAPAREPGFFPAIQYFSDCVAALPNEVISHLSMLKEVEAKVHDPEQDLLKLADEILALPPAQRYQSSGQTAAHSLAGSVNGSVYNGHASPGEGHHLGREIQNSQPRVEDVGDMTRRQLSANFAAYIRGLNPILDEKIAVLHTTNESVRMHLERMTSSYKNIAGEVSYEARVGSTSHWAYVDRGESKKPDVATVDRSRGDVRALADAAEGDLASSRSEARREAIMAKKQRHQQVDSDFDDRPVCKKPHGNKGRKHADVDKVAGLGITNGGSQPKKRKLEKGPERAVTTALALARGTGASPCENPGSEFVPVKRKKPGPAPGTKKKFAHAPNNDVVADISRPPPIISSPALQASPMMGSSSRPNASRARGGSSANVFNDKARPASSASNRPPTGAGTPSLKPSDSVATAETETMVGGLPAGGLALKQEENAAADESTGQDSEVPMAVTMTKRGARTSKTATPITSVFPADALNPRARSMRTNGNGNGIGETAPGPATGKRGHKKGPASIAQSAHVTSMSNSRRGSLVAADNALAADAAPERTSTRPQRSRRSAVHDDDALDANDDDDVEAEGEGVGDGSEGEEEDADGVKYCYCNDSGYGMMVGCDNDDCARAWFHLQCVRLKEAPGENETWYCPDCTKDMGKK